MSKTITKLPFDLKKALAGHPLVTRDGRKARIIHHDNDDPETPILVEYIDLDDKGPTEIWHLADGTSNILEIKSDLFLTPVTKRPDRHKTVNTVRRIMAKRWMTLEQIQTELDAKLHWFPLQSVSARVRDLRKDEFGGYDIRRKSVGDGVFAYRNFRKRGAVAR